MSTATELRLSEAQLRSIAWAQARINVWSGTIRSGKSVASLLRLLIAINAAPPGLIVATAVTLDAAWRNVFSPLMDPAVTGAASGLVQYTRGASTARVLGRQVEVITANDRGAEKRVRGSTIVISYVDEATMIPEVFFDQLLGRMSGTNARMFATTNPDAPMHWLNQRFLAPGAPAADSVMHFELTLSDNPGLSREYVEAISREYVGLWYDRMILGKWVMAQGAIYDGWDPKINIVDEVPQVERWVACGVDYGTTNPFHAVMLGVASDPVGGSALYVTDEWRHDSKAKHVQLTDKQYSARLREWALDTPYGGGRGMAPEYTAVDPSAASFRVQLYRDGWQSVAGHNAVGDGLRTTASLIKAGKLKVAKRCKYLIGEIPGYSWDDEAAKLGRDEPIKKNDHGCDALRYAIKTTEPLWYRQIWG